MRTLLKRIWYRLFFRPWTPEQLKERVALSVKNTNYDWGKRLQKDFGPPVTGEPHRFDLSETGMTEEGKEFYERLRKYEESKDGDE